MNAGVHLHQVDIATADGAMPTWICHPRQAGPHPALIFFMDAPGMREELRGMARRLAGAGYYVMLPDLYYRTHSGDMGAFRGNEDAQHKQLIGRLMASLSIDMVMADTAALIFHARNDQAAALGAMGCVGYCMSGQYALTAAARYPYDVAAAACFYGTQLMTDNANSPHRSVRGTRAEFYVGWAGIDPFAPQDQMAPFAAALHDAGVDAHVELYPDVWHGFAFPERLVYNEAAADLHWERLLDLFQRRLSTTII